MIRPRKPPSQTWRTFLNNHTKTVASINSFTVPPATFRILCVFFVLSHDRRQVVHFNAAGHPIAAWTAQQMVEDLPFDTAHWYPPRDRDRIYDDKFRSRARSLFIKEVRIAPRRPWQSPYVKCLIGSIRRGCLNHVIVFNERRLKQLQRSYFEYYHTVQTHLSLHKQCPNLTQVQPVERGNVIALPKIGGLHQEFARHAA